MRISPDEFPWMGKKAIKAFWRGVNSAEGGVHGDVNSDQVGRGTTIAG